MHLRGLTKSIHVVVFGHQKDFDILIVSVIWLIWYIWSKKNVEIVNFDIVISELEQHELQFNSLIYLSTELYTDVL
jgi:hypothetical protein